MPVISYNCSICMGLYHAWDQRSSDSSDDKVDHISCSLEHCNFVLQFRVDDNIIYKVQEDIFGRWRLGLFTSLLTFRISFYFLLIASKRELFDCD